MGIRVRAKENAATRILRAVLLGWFKRGILLGH
jgi:hypothetical protein